MAEACRREREAPDEAHPPPRSRGRRRRQAHVLVRGGRRIRRAQARGARSVRRRRRRRAGQGNRQTVKTANADRGQRTFKKYVWKTTWRSDVQASHGQSIQVWSDYTARHNAIAEIDLCIEIAYRHLCGKTWKNVFPQARGKLDFPRGKTTL